MNDCYILENGSQILLRNNSITQVAQRTNKLLYNVQGLAMWRTLENVKPINGSRLKLKKDWYMLLG